MLRTLGIAIPTLIVGWLSAIVFPPSNFSFLAPQVVELRSDVTLPDDSVGGSTAGDDYRLRGMLQKGSRCEMTTDKGAVVYLRCRMMVRESVIR